jgi:hypothetical protein
MTFTKKVSFPVIDNFRSTSLVNAFVLNALLAAIISTLTVELRHRLEDKRSFTYVFFNRIFGNFTKMKILDETQKVLIVFIAAFTCAIIAYNFMFYLFGFGGGMLTSSKNPSYF